MGGGRGVVPIETEGAAPGEGGAPGCWLYSLPGPVCWLHGCVHLIKIDHAVCACVCTFLHAYYTKKSLNGGRGGVTFPRVSRLLLIIGHY